VTRRPSWLSQQLAHPGTLTVCAFVFGWAFVVTGLARLLGSWFAWVGAGLFCLCYVGFRTIGVLAWNGARALEHDNKGTP